NKPYKKLWEMNQTSPDITAVWVGPNAGLVLLWPYFQALFDRAGLLEKGAFVDRTAQQKAILILAYLGMGELKPTEPDLIFNKVLCGYPVEVPILIDFDLDQTLCDLCDGLIAAAVQHWKTIGATSVATFRETFLVREGNLNLTEKYWQLQVTPKAYDLLLKQLPWSISTVNLSWMERTMKVEWG
ncbi:MAG: contractile injection system tape measure protein, partial [Bacteroidota bacterium]